MAFLQKLGNNFLKPFGHTGQEVANLYEVINYFLSITS